MEVQEDGENVALKKTMGENQKFLFLILSTWLNCKAWRLQTFSKDNSTWKHSIFCL